MTEELVSSQPSLAQLERSYINRLLREFDGHRARVAGVLGISVNDIIDRAARGWMP